MGCVSGVDFSAKASDAEGAEGAEDSWDELWTAGSSVAAGCV